MAAKSGPVYDRYLERWLAGSGALGRPETVPSEEELARMARPRA